MQITTEGVLFEVYESSKYWIQVFKEEFVVLVEYFAVMPADKFISQGDVAVDVFA